MTALSVPGYEIYVDDFSGDDDAKMDQAFSALMSTQGGTAILAARDYHFGNLWETGYDSNVTAAIKIKGQGGIAKDSSSVPKGATTCYMSYSGAMAARMDFQHNGSIEITGILFADQGASPVPFLQTTNAVPNIHHNAFLGSATGTACFQDAIVLGGVPGTTSPRGDNAQYNGYAGAISENAFYGIRRIALLNPAANGVQIYGNTVSFTCGSNLPMGACIEMAGGTTPYFVYGVNIYGNCIEETGYPVGIKGVNVFYSTIGPNGFFDAGPGVTQFHHTLDAGSSFNTVIMGASGVGGPVQALLDGSMANDVVWPASVGYVSSVMKTQKVFLDASGSPHGPTIMANGIPVLVSDVYGEYSGWKTVVNTGIYPMTQAYTIASTNVADGSIITGSNIVTSLTAAWTVLDVGVYIRATGIANASVIQQVYSAATAVPWAASFGYVAGQVARPTAANAHLYQCTVAGTSSGIAPTWPTSGGTVTDGGVTWKDLGASTAALFSTNATATNTGVVVYFGRKSTALSMTGFTKHHIVSSGSAPTGAVQTGAGAGATVSYAGNDLAQTVTLTTAGTPAPGALLITTFNVAYDVIPKVQLTPKNAAAAALQSAGWYATCALGTWTLTAVGTPPTGACIFDVVTIQ